MKQIVFFITLVFSTACFATVVHGICQIHDTTTSELTCFGSAELNHVTVNGALSVFGPLKLTNTIVKGSVDVKGLVTAINSTIQGPAIIYGPMTATTMLFNSNINSFTTTMILNKTEVQGSILIESSDKSPTLELTDNTIVRGNIEFSKQSGIVKLSKDSQVIGAVTNGTKQNS